MATKPRPNHDEPKNKRRNSWLTVTLTPDEKRQLEDRAARDDRTLSYLARKAIVKMLEDK